MNDSEDGDLLGDVGFMFDACQERSLKVVDINGIAVKLKCIDEDPGHVQSGQHLWPGANKLSTYLSGLWDSEKDRSPNRQRILELGAGCGLCGITCAKLMCSVGAAGTVFLTDYDPGSLQLLSENIAENGLQQVKECLAPGTCVHEGVHLMVLDMKWGRPLPISLGGDRNIDLLVGSDLIYCASVVEPLFRSVGMLLAASGEFYLSCSFDIGEDARAELERCLKIFQLSLNLIHGTGVYQPIGECERAHKEEEKQIELHSGSEAIMRIFRIDSRSGDER